MVESKCQCRKIAVDSSYNAKEALGESTQLETWRTLSAIRMCMARQQELAINAP